MKRIIFLNRFFHPDHSATSQILSDLAFHLAAAGREVHVVTSRQLYDAPGARLPAHEIVNGVTVHRVAGTQFGRSSLLGRGVDYLSFYRSMRKIVGELVEPGDILVAKTDPPLLSVLAMHAGPRGAHHLVNWLQDLYPEVAAQLGVPFTNGAIGRAITAMRNRSLRRADANVTLSDAMAARIRSCGVAAARVHTIPNWADDESIAGVAPADNPMRRAWKLDGQFVVGHSGNLGRAHEFDTVLDAAELLRNEPRIVFVMIGGGRQFERLAASAAARGLDSKFRFFAYQDRAALSQSLSAPDVHWVSLRSGLDGLVFPSKLYGVMAAGRPLIAVAPAQSDLATLVTRHDCGAAVEPGDARGFADFVLRLRDDTQRRAALGRNARAALDTHFTRRQAFARWRGVLDSIG